MKNFLLLIALTVSSLQSMAQKTDKPKDKPQSEQTSSRYNAPGDIPLEDFFLNPTKTDFKISPDGSVLAYLSPQNKRMNIFIQDLPSGNPRMLTNFSDRDVANFEWGNNRTIVFLKDNGGDENFLLYAMNIDNAEIKTVTPSGTRAAIVDLLEEDDEHIAFSCNIKDPAMSDLFKLNLKSLQYEMIARNPGNVTNWIFDHSGKLRLATATDGVNSEILKLVSGEIWAPILSLDFRESVTPLFFDFKNINIYCASNLKRDKSAIVLLDLEKTMNTPAMRPSPVPPSLDSDPALVIEEDERIKEVIFEHPDVDVYDLNFSRKRQTITTVVYQTDKMQRVILDKLTKIIMSDLEQKLPKGMLFDVVSMDLEESRWIVRTMSDKSLGAYYYYEVDGGKLVKLEELSQWLDPSLMAEMKPISFESRHGEIIHGYLTLPRGIETNIPVIVNPHGGPWARDSWGFEPEVQFLASRGYGVLQINYTGSTGYGRRFWEKGFKQWGQLMQDDISDGVAYLLNNKIAVEGRVGIYGGSYGGYATLAGLAFTPELYACGIDYVGVSNLFTFLENIPPYWQPYREMLYEMVGDPNSDYAMMEAVSPALHADRIKAPLLIAQGAKDPRVKKLESDQIVEALKKRGVKVEYIVEPEEGHGFHNEENRFKFYRAMESFLRLHLPVTTKPFVEPAGK